MPRMLMGDFGALTRVGLKDVLHEDRRTFVAEERIGDDLLDRLVEALPDVVILDLDSVDTDGIARHIAAEYPAVKIVACSSQQPVMRIYPRFHRGESFETPLDAERLIEAVEDSR